MTDAGMSLNGGASTAGTSNGQQSQLQKAMALGSYFLSGAMAINASQFLGAPLQLINQDWYNTWIAWTKQSFGLLTMTMTQWWAPTVVKVSGDKSMRGQLTTNPDGTLRCLFPNRLVLMANHQIYTDWMYLWWIAYTNDMHGRLYIILKESLRNIPVLGWGMQLSQFIFMKRNWEEDKPNMQKHLAQLAKPGEPMWLMLFPEGTNLAPNTRERSKAWARKNDLKDMQHQLLPRSTGLQFCLDELKGSVDYLYDCTIAYEGVKRGEYAQDVFTLKASYLEGKPPKAVHIHWRRFPLSSIPIKHPEVFGKWLDARWREKDYLLEMWHRTGQFPNDTGAEKLPSGVVRRGCGYINSQIRPSQWYEFLQIFAPMGVLALVLSVFYGALPEWFLKTASKQAVQSNAVQLPDMKVNGADPNFSWLSFLDSDKQGGAVQQLLGKFLPLNLGASPSEAQVPESVDEKVEMVKNNFITKMKEEEASRKAHKRKAPGSTASAAPTVSFAQRLKTEEAKRGGSTITAASAAPTTTSAIVRKAAIKSAEKSDFSFSQALENEQGKRTVSRKQGENKAPSSLAAIKRPPTTAGAAARKPSVSFAQTIRNEEAKRHGTVNTTTSKPPPSVASTKPAKKSNLSFSQAMKDEESKRNGPVTKNTSQAPSSTSQPPKLSTANTATKNKATPAAKKPAAATGSFADKLKAEESKRKGDTQSTPTANGAPTKSKPKPKVQDQSKPPKLATKPVSKPSTAGGNTTSKPLAKSTPSKINQASSKQSTVSATKKATPISASNGVKQNPPKLDKE